MAPFLSCEDANKPERDDPSPEWYALRHTLARALYGLAPLHDVVAEILGHSREARQDVTATYTAANPEAVRSCLEEVASEFPGKGSGVVVSFNRGERTG